MLTALACWIFGHCPAWVPNKYAKWWADGEIRNGEMGRKRCVRCWR